MILQEELKKVEVNTGKWAILHYLELESAEDQNLKEAIAKFPKGLEQIWEYIIKKASENQKDRHYADDGTKVFAWAKEYVIDYEAIDKDWNKPVSKPIEPKQEPKKESKPKQEAAKPKLEKAKDTGFIEEEGQMSLFDFI